ncbi:hypothetical protein VTK26DRAFT_2946 [Humicola hyalothermophila]
MPQFIIPAQETVPYRPSSPHAGTATKYASTSLRLSSSSCRTGTATWGGINIAWHQADLRDMGVVVPDKAVDVAFDKAALDAMVYGSGRNPPDEVKENTGRYLAEVHRVLKDDGIFTCVSFRQLHFVRPLLAASGLWDAEGARAQGGQRVP